MLFIGALFSVLSLAPAVVGSRLNRLERDTGITTSYSSNWAGAVWDVSDEIFAYVTGTFTVPTLEGASGNAAAAWIGIDGETCANVNLQTGVSFVIEDGQTTYFAWYDWYPAVAQNFSGIAIDVGDDIKLTLLATSATSGIATVENLTNGQRVSQPLTSSVPLCRQNVEWIVEDYKQGANFNYPTSGPFGKFSPITFTNAVAIGKQSYTPSGATLFDIKQNNQILTSVSTSGSSLTVKSV